MRLESGNHFGAITPVGTLVTRRASPPLTAMTYSCACLSSPRLDTNAISSPSGLHAGVASLPASLVSCRALPGLVGTSHRSASPLFFSMSYFVTGTTARRPSGEIAGSPSRFSFHIASAVYGCAACASGASAKLAAIAKRAPVATTRCGFCL